MEYDRGLKDTNRQKSTVLNIHGLFFSPVNTFYINALYLSPTGELWGVAYDFTGLCECPIVAFEI